MNWLGFAGVLALALSPVVQDDSPAEPVETEVQKYFRLAREGRAVVRPQAARRLLEKPDEKDQREIVLFGAVRRYARSVEKLRDASDAMDSVLRGSRAGGRELRPEQVLQMNNEIKASFDELQEAEQALLDLIARETGG